MKCSLLEKKITGDSARTAVFIYILVLYIYPRIVVIVSFHFEIKSRLVLLLFLNGGKVVVWLFFSSFPKNDVSPEKRESSVVFSFGLSFPERKKERKKEKKRPFNSKIFCPNGFFFRPQNHSLLVTKNSVERNNNSILLSIRASAAQETRTTRTRTRRRLETSF